MTDLLERSASIGSAVLRLSIARGGGLLDEITSDVYVRGLLESEADLVRRACEELGREPREDYQQAMPPLPTILERVKSIHRADIDERARLRALPPSPNDRRYMCWRCEDSPQGWMVLMSCPAIDCGAPRFYKGEPREHAPHTFTARCPCWLEKNREHLLTAKQEHDSEKKREKKRSIPGDYYTLLALDDGRYPWAKPRELWPAR